jgi:hypothetical protein
MLTTSRSEKRLRLAGICLAIGLIIEAICLICATPIAFIVFVAIGGLLIFIGLVVYVHSQASTAVGRD